MTQWDTDSDSDTESESEQEIESIPEIDSIIDVDIDNEINYTKILTSIRDTVDNNHNKRINLILCTKLDTKLNINDDHKIFKVTIYKNCICIKIYLYEDTHCEPGLFEYRYVDSNYITKNNNINGKTDHLLIILLFLVIIQYRITQIKRYNKEDIGKTDNKIYDYLSYHDVLYDKVNSSYNSYHMGYHYLYQKRQITKLINLIKFRIKHTYNEDVASSRSIKSIFGKFEDTISPNMIQKIFTW